MTDYGIKISKPGFDVKATPTESTKKNFIILDTVDAHKMISSELVAGGTINHGLGYVPFFIAFQVDDINSPTTFTATRMAGATDTQITNIPDPGYIMVFHRTT